MTRPPTGHPVRTIAAPWLAAAATQAVFEALERGGFAARAVGGIVRNSLLGLPATDIDIATDARPEDTLRLAAAAGLKTVPTGLAHGTVTVISGGVPHEVTTLRRDVTTDGRHAEVAFTDDWAADAARRDFTINALYCGRDGAVFDPLGGLADLDPIRIRFIGDASRRIEEDYLRILRFFRFTAIYVDHGVLDPTGLAACTALRGGLARISGERIQAELLKLLAAPHAVGVTRALIGSGVYATLFDGSPQIDHLTRMAAIEARLGRPPDAVLRLAALAVTTPEGSARLDARLKLSARDRDRLAAAPLAAAAITPAMGEPAAKAAAYKLGPDTYLDGILLAWARTRDRTTGAAFARLATLLDRWQPPVFPLAGRDVLAAGVPNGPLVGELLGELEAQWIESGFLLQREELLAVLQYRVTGAPPINRG